MQSLALGLCTCKGPMDPITEPLRSHAVTLAVVTVSCLCIASAHDERSFSHAGPASWNSLPADLRAISDCSCFKSKLKTYLFQLAFNIQ